MAFAKQMKTAVGSKPPKEIAFNCGPLRLQAGALYNCSYRYTATSDAPCWRHTRNDAQIRKGAGITPLPFVLLPGPISGENTAYVSPPVNSIRMQTSLNSITRV